MHSTGSISSLRHIILLPSKPSCPPDSSRFWPAEGYEPGHAQPSFDKQFARDWLKSHQHDWELPQEIVDKTIEKYLQGYELLTGKPLQQ